MLRTDLLLKLCFFQLTSFWFVKDQKDIQQYVSFSYYIDPVWVNKCQCNSSFRAFAVSENSHPEFKDLTSIHLDTLNTCFAFYFKKKSSSSAFMTV